MSERFSAEVIDKAERLVGRGDRIKRDDEHPEAIFWVKGSGDNAYRVQVGPSLEWITCTCPHGLSTGGGQCRCYHAAAVLMMIEHDRREGHEAATDALGGAWAEKSDG